MKKAKYINNPLIYILLIILPIVGGIVTLCFKEYIGCIVCFGISIIFCIPLIIFRKRFFLKMIVDEQGIRTCYRKNIIKDIEWEKIKDALAVNNSHGGYIILSDKNLYTGKDSWKNSKEIFIMMNSDFAIEFYKYKDKVSVPIKNINCLSPSIVERISK